MSITPSNTTSTNTALTAAQLAASNGTGTGNNAAGGSGSGSAASALGQLSSNYSTFLTLLTTQLKNQDPSSPMDSNQFTTELVQFSGVEQQINTNSNLSQLISLAQAANVSQASAMLGSAVTATANQLPLQNGKATLNFTAPSAEPVNIIISEPSGKAVYDASLNATAGKNTWNWDGTDASGNTLPDGAYNVSLTNTPASGTATPIPFSITGTATSLDSTSNNLMLNLGAVSVPFSSITSVNRPNTGT